MRDPSVYNFATALHSATKEPKDKALDALISLAETQASNLTDQQTAEVYKRAAAAARNARNFAKADELAERIPIDSVQKSVRMLNGVGKKEANKVIERYGREAIETWPFWAAAEGYYARGIAFAATGNSTQARTDLRAALELTTDKSLRVQIERALAP